MLFAGKGLTFWDEKNRNVFKVWLHAAPFIVPGICRNGSACARLLSVKAPLFIYFQAKLLLSRASWSLFLSQWTLFHLENEVFFFSGLFVLLWVAQPSRNGAVDISDVLQYNEARLHLFYLVLNGYAIWLSETVTRLAKTAHRLIVNCFLGNETLCRRKCARRAS